MNDETLLAVLAAIIYAGADDSEGTAGYTVAQAVGKAAKVVAYIRGRDAVLLLEARKELGL